MSIDVGAPPRIGPSPPPRMGRGAGDGGPDLGHLERLLGDLVIEGEIAATSRAVIHRIHLDTLGGRPSALKVALQPSNPEDLARFRHEARLLSEVRHPNVVEVHEVGVLPGDYPFLVMELVEPLVPEAVRERIETSGWDSFYDLAIQAAAGLAHIHRHGVVHLDLKPDNLGFDAQGRLKILDFGLAQSLRDPLDRRIRGTLAYVAPEILLQDSYDHRADLYSLGLTLWELATGVLPSAGDDRQAIQFHLTASTPDPWQHEANLPEALGEILIRLLDRDPRGRYPGAAGLLEELGRAAGRPIDPGELTVGSGQVLTSRLVGRDEALGTLALELDAARRGESRTVLVEGPDGVGKSRLLREFRLLAAVEGAVIGSGTASPERSEPLEPVMRALAGLGVEVEPRVEGAPSGRDPVRERERFSLYRKISRALAARATTPLVMILEDLHHASRETAELLGFLASDLKSVPVLVIATRRASRGGDPDSIPRADHPAATVRESRDDSGPASPLDEAPLKRLRLDPLGREATVGLIEASLGLGVADSDAPQLSDGFYDQVFEASGGFPGRVQQILRHLIDEDGLHYQDGSWEVRPSVLGSLGGAGGVEALDWHRMASLAPELKRILEAAAVIGEPFRLATLAALLDDEPSAVYESLARVVGAGFLDRLLEAEGAVYTFSQRRLSETLYATLQGAERSDLHLGLARLLERRVKAGQRSLAARVADHFWRAGHRVESLPYLQEAAERAASVYGHADAASLYGRAAEAALEDGDRETAADARAAQARSLASAGLPARSLRVYQELLASGGDGKGRSVAGSRAAARSARLLLDKGRIHGRLGEHEAALASFEQALAGFEMLADEPDLELEIELLHGKAVALRDLGQADAAFEAARGALRRASDAGLDSQRAFLLNQLAMAFYARGGQERARRLARRSLRAASKAAEPRLEVLARNTLAMVAWKTGDTAGALDLFSENLAACERMNDPWGQLPALNNLGVLHCSLGDWRSARDLLARSLEMKRRLGARQGEALTRINLAEVDEVLGDWRRAQRHVERALALLADQPDHPERIAATTQLAALARKRGDLERADELLAEAQRHAEGTGDRDLVLRALLERGLLELDREAHGPAGEALERGLELARASGSRELEVRHLTALAQLGLATDDRAAAARRTAAARQVIGESADGLAEGRLAALEGQLAALADDGAAAEEAFERSARLLSRVGASYDQARTLYRWGLATWNAELAVERLERALQVFQQLGAAADAQQVRSALARIGGEGQGAGAPPVDGTLYEVVKVINSSLDFQEVLDRTMDLVLERLGAERGMIVLVDPLTRELDVAVARNLAGGAEEGQELSESVVRRVIDTHEPVLAVDAVSDSRFVGAESIVARHILSILCVPLAIRDRLAGAIYIDHRESRHLFTDADRDFLVAFADGAAVAIENARLYGRLEEARKRLESENASLKREIFTSHHLGTLIGKSRAIAALKGTLELVAQGASTVLIRGESGTGKGLVARIIHNISPRRKAPFVHFNCAALPETLVESELFGHEKGAFTGAAARKPGRFELADGGTIFLDEIGKVSRSVQAKLLRVVEDKEFERVGGTKTLSSDVRIIAATNLNLEQAIARNEFREDLYYRLNIIPIILPPLRERREDVPYLVQHFLERIGRDLGLAPKEVDPAVLDLFARHDWPGNVRELEAAIHRALVLTPGDTLTPDSFAWIQVATGTASAAVVDAATLASSGSDLSSLELADGGYQALLDELDGQLLRAALVQSDGKIREAARLLGIARNTLKSKMKKFEIEA